MDGSLGHQEGYRLDRLGWLQFERLASLVLEAEAGLRDLHWQDRAYRGRVAWVEGPVVLAATGVRLPGPVAIAVAWVRDSRSKGSRLSEFVRHMLALADDREWRSTDSILLITNLDGRVAKWAWAEELFVPPERVVVLGAHELGQCLDRHAALRSAMPSVLGLRELGDLIARDVRDRSSLDIERAQALARVFVPTRAYERARLVLERHRFVVLTGPPEMGKTAIAHMVALAQLTAGWEAYDCISPEQVWRAFDRDRPQVFVADDAFGSTEYRPDAAERWARELGRMLGALDERHWLIWTSRPAPLKSGLRRVQRERGSERFPAPGEVLVDASDLDLAEKTLILFRHVKDHPASGAVRELVRSAGLTIVEHEHFTPERIRRFVTNRLAELVARTRHPSMQRDRVRRGVVLRAVERELATPTQEMATSFRALGEEHRALLIALLDTPAGLTDERDLAAVMRRHYPVGLSRPPHELIDRLTDHFLRISSLGIDWVHPSWRDLVIDEVCADRGARRRFLRTCGPYGALLVLSHEGGMAGERKLPLLVEDGDWDTFTDRVGELLRQLEDPDQARLLLAHYAMLGADLDASQRAEAQSLTEYTLGATRRSWDQQRQPLPVFLLQAWYLTNSRLPEPLDPPQLGATWAELHPASLGPGDQYSDDQHSELPRTSEWLALAQTLAKYDRHALDALGFPKRDAATLLRVSDATTNLLINAPNRHLRSLAEEVLGRLRDVAPEYATQAGVVNDALEAPTPEDRWWVPEDIPAPPTTDRVTPAPSIFTRDDVARVLGDL
jgi:hypothetical protein